ncbi:nudix hydrolase domain-containing protein, partial [Haematococcus lacustris]
APGRAASAGGHLEFGESFEACAVREVLEETGITLRETDLSLAWANNNIFDDQQPPKHYVTIFMHCCVPEETTASLMEPDKCEGWEWQPYGQETTASLMEPDKCEGWEWRPYGQLTIAATCAATCATVPCRAVGRGPGPTAQRPMFSAADTSRTSGPGLGIDLPRCTLAAATCMDTWGYANL